MTDPTRAEFDDQLHLSGLFFNTSSAPENAEDDLFEIEFNGSGDFEKIIEKDLNDSEQDYITLEGRIENGIAVLNSIIKTGGMCRSFAEEAHAVIPEFSKVPLNYYSQTPTRTQYITATEELITGIIALIAAAAAAVIALVYKIYKWLTGNKEKATEKDVVEAAKEKGEAVTEIKDDLQKTAEQVSTMETMVNRMNITIKDDGGKEYHCQSIQMFIDRNLVNVERYERMKKFLELTDPMLKDTIRGGPYSKVIGDVQKIAQNVISVLEMKIRLFHDVVQSNVKDFSPEADRRNRALLERLEKDNTVHFEGKEVTLRELSIAIRDRETEMLKNTKPEPIKFDTLITQLYDKYNSDSFERLITFICDSTKSLSRCQDIIKQLEKRMGEFTTDGMPGKPSEHVGEPIRAMLRSINDDVISLGHIILYVNQYIEKTSNTFNLCIVMCVEVLTKLTDAMAANKQVIPPEWYEATKQVRNIRARINANAKRTRYATVV